MSFKFMHNYVSTATKNVPTLSDIMKKAQTSQKLAETKTASSQKTTKVASKEDMPDFIKEKIEQSKAKKNGKDKPEDEDGEEKKDDKKGKKENPFAKKDKAAAGTSYKTKIAESDEGESSGQLEDKKNPTNDPKVEDGDKKSKGGSKSKSEDEGESSGQLDVEPLHQKGESTGEKPAGLDTMKGKESKKESTSRGRFVRVAALTSKQKDFLRSVWSTYWPKSFIDAFLARA